MLEVRCDRRQFSVHSQFTEKSKVHYIQLLLLFILLMHSSKHNLSFMLFAVSSSFEAGTLCRRALAWSNRRTLLTPTGGTNSVCIIQHKFSWDLFGNVEYLLTLDAILFISLNPPCNCRSVDSQVFTDWTYGLPTLMHANNFPPPY